MLNTCKKVAVVLVSSSLVLTTGCSFLGGGKKPNTKAPEEILKDAKSEIAANFKTSLADALDKYEDDYLSTFVDWPTTGDWTLNLNVDAGENGKADVSFKESFKVDSNSFDGIDQDSSLLDMMKSVKGEADIEISVSADAPVIGEVKGSLSASIADMDGVYYFKLNEVVVPENVPDMPSQSEVDAMIDPFKGKWFKIDVVGLIESNPQLSQVFDVKFSQLSNVDAEAMKELFSGYIDQVIMKENWLEVREDSKTDTSKGDQYDVVFTEARIKDFLMESYDFVNENFEDVDAVFDITQTRNPFVMTAVMTVEDVKSQMTASRDQFRQGLEGEDIPDMTFQATFSGDKLVVFGFNYDLPADAEAEGTVAMAINFENEEHNLDKSNVDLNVDVKPVDDEGHIKVEGTMNVKSGSNRVSDVKLEVVMPDGELNASLSASEKDETKEFVSLDMDLDFSSKEELEEGITGFKGNLSLENGGSFEIDGGFMTVPAGGILDVKMSGDFDENDGEGSVEFTVNPPNDQDTVSGKFGVEYEMEDEDVSYELPEGAEDAQDMTGDLQQLLSGGLMMAPGLGAGAPDGVQFDPSKIDGVISPDMTEEEIQKLLMESGAMMEAPAQ